jgi:Domain of unknown function (DUF4279)
VAEGLETEASVSISGDDLDPDQITKLMGCAPNRSEKKGQVLTIGGRGKAAPVAHRGLWRLQANRRSPDDLEAQIRELLAMLPQDLALWRELSARYEVSMFCGLFMGGWNNGIGLSPELLLAIAERGMALDLDIYSPTRDAEESG